jgi:hypothetical protein
LLIIGFEKRNYQKTFFILSGVFLAMSIGFKLYNIFLVPSFLLTLFIFPKDRSYKEKLTSGLIPFGSGFLLGMIPIIISFFQDIKAFMFNNFEYHLLNSRWMESIGFTEGMSWTNKLNYLKKLLIMPSNMAIILGLLVVVFYIVSNSNKKQLPKSPFLFFLVVALISSLLILFQRPFWIQYFSFPIPFLVLCIASGYTLVSESRKKLVMILLLLTALISVTTGSRILFSSIRYLLNTNSWTTVKVFKTSTYLRRQIEQFNTKGPGKIATLSPIYALQAGLPIYNEFATSIFYYRVAHLVSPENQSRYGIIGYNRLNKFLSKNPPRAILLERGGLFRLNSQFIQFAKNQNYKEVKLKYNHFILYVLQN